MVMGSNTNSDTLKITHPGVKNSFCFQKENGNELMKNGKNSIAEKNGSNSAIPPCLNMAIVNKVWVITMPQNKALPK